MDFLPKVIPLLWLAWALYWLVAAAGAKRTERRESLGSRLAHLIPLTIAAVLLWPWRVAGLHLYERTDLVRVIGTVVVAAGLGFAVWARLHIGRNWSGTVTVKEGHELIRTGPYRFVRHPIYTGLILAVLGTAFVLTRPRGFVAVAIVFLSLWRKSRLEERWMEETFGEAYARYRAEVAGIVPYLL
jgi:protein-S-isoprenylcysteine O-methyltransferase Ste14